MSNKSGKSRGVQRVAGPKADPERKAPGKAPAILSPPKQAAAPSRVEAPADLGLGDTLSRPSAPIVGIGASAGGLEAFSQLLRALPANTGMMFILVQHLAPTHESVLPELLAATTKMPVLQVTDGMALAPNHVYVIPPNMQMVIIDGRLHLATRDQHHQFLPIDQFFHSLAEYGQGRAVGIILSGTASDGSVGLREIKAAGGITIAQDPASCKFDGMPRAAIATNSVDLVLTPQKIAEELSRLAHHPLVQRPPSPADDGEGDVGERSCRGSLACCGRRRGWISPTTSARQSAGGCNGGWCCIS